MLDATCSLAPIQDKPNSELFYKLIMLSSRQPGQMDVNFFFWMPVLQFKFSALIAHYPGPVQRLQRKLLLTPEHENLFTAGEACESLSILAGLFSSLSSSLPLLARYCTSNYSTFIILHRSIYSVYKTIYILFFADRSAESRTRPTIFVQTTGATLSILGIKSSREVVFLAQECKSIFHYIC